jgi:hypothetical protein
MEEVWKPIQGYEGHYEISNLGNVKSLAKVTPGEYPYKRTNGGSWRRIRKIEYKFID